MAMQFNRALPTPVDTKEKYPITLKALEAKEKNDFEIRKFDFGSDIGSEQYFCFIKFFGIFNNVSLFRSHDKRV